MNWLRELGRRLLALFRRGRFHADLEEEMSLHRELREQEQVERGLSPAEAHYAVQRRFGNDLVLREESRDMWGWSWLETFVQDMRYGLRQLRRNPGFTTVAVLTLALGIGANTAMFSVVKAVLLNPLGYQDPGRLVYLSLDNPLRNGQDSRFTLQRFEQLSAAKSFTGIGAFLSSPEDVTLSGRNEPEVLEEARVSANFLDILGVRPVVGRGFVSGEDQPGGVNVAMISAELWKRRFGSAPGIAGKTVKLNSTPYSIVGVLPEGFEFPFSGVDVWVTRPWEWSALPSRFWPFVNVLKVFARLKPQVSRGEARAEIQVLNRQFILAHPAASLEKRATLRVMWLKDRLVENVRPMLWTLLGTVGLVLLISCANVASLLMARASSRSQEFAVRAAIGAGRGRLVQQLLTESLMLATGGGALGILLAKWALSAASRLNFLSLAAGPNPLYLPGAGQIKLDGAVLAFTLVLSASTSLLFGLLPTLRWSRPDLADHLRESGSRRGLSGRRGWTGASTRGLLVIGQIALALVLLIGSALMTESFARLRSVNPGFQAANRLTMKIALPPVRYDTGQKKAAFFNGLVERVQSLTGILGAATATALPTTSRTQTNIMAVEGRFSWDESEPPTSWQFLSVTPDYFRTLGIPLLRGREFSERDYAPGARPVVIVNESFARHYWPEYPSGENPVGKHMSEGADKSAGLMEIVGIVADIRERGLADASAPEFYLTTAVHPPETAYLISRTEGDPLRFVNAIREQVLAMDRDQAVSSIRTMAVVLAATMGRRRLTTWMLGLFACIALLLTMVGIYGVIAYSVVQRTNEIGIRLALGAEKIDVLKMVVGQGFKLALIGVAIGIAGALAVTRFLSSLLYVVKPTDPLTFIVVSLILISVALLASYIPARRAMKVDPIVALRHE
jgi:putative ABC transport system permease protein